MSRHKLGVASIAFERFVKTNHPEQDQVALRVLVLEACEGNGHESHSSCSRLVWPARPHID